MNNRLNFVIRLVCAIILLFIVFIFLGKNDNEKNGMQVKARETNSVEVLDDYEPPIQEQITVSVSTNEIEAKHIVTQPVEMLYQTSAKTYMDYRCITNTNSPQYQYIYNSGEITVCEDGFLRTDDGYIGVAMGYYFGDIGSKYILHLDTGKTIPVVKIEAKASQHSIQGFVGCVAYDIVEFVIDTKAQWMKENTWGNGYIFSGNFNNYDLFNGTIVDIDKIIEEG